MRVFTKSTISSFCAKHPQSRIPLREWYHSMRKGDWQSPQEVKQSFARCSILANNRIVFRIKGNDYRVIVELSYEFKAVYICFVGTHAEYYKVDASTVYIR